jgi:hypothetical protein
MTQADAGRGIRQRHRPPDAGTITNLTTCVIQHEDGCTGRRGRQLLRRGVCEVAKLWKSHVTSEATASGVNVRAPMEMATGNLSDASIAGVSVGKQPLAIFHILSIDYQGSCESPLE